MDSSPRIYPIHKAYGKTIYFRNVEVTDAEFIISLRSNINRNKYLSPIDQDLEKQRAWIISYAKSLNQAYFIIYNNSDQRIGTVRIYEAAGNSFSWGSWLIAPNAHSMAAIESALLVYKIGIDFFGFSKAHFKVSKSNISVCRFHEKFGADRVSESTEEIQYSIDLDQIKKSFSHYQRFLPESIKLEISPSVDKHESS